MPVNNVSTVTLAGGVLCALSMACSSFLFLQRVRAVYADNPKVQLCFSAFWIVYLLSEVTIFIGIKSTYISSTHYFANGGVHPMTALTVIAAVLYDTSVFIAISYKIASTYSGTADGRIGCGAFIYGKALPRLSRAVLHGGQQYYLQVVTFVSFQFLLTLLSRLNVMVLIPIGILLYLPNVPPILKSTFTVFLPPLMASMSCRLYRSIKLFDCDAPPPCPISEIRFV